MEAKLEIRVLDSAGQLLGWVAHAPLIKGDGRLRAKGAVTVLIETAGVPALVSIHWTDVNVEVRMEISSPAVAVGQWVTVFQPRSVMMTLGEPAKGLPPITYRQTHVVLDVPTGTVGSRGRVVT